MSAVRRESRRRRRSRHLPAIRAGCRSASPGRHRRRAAPRPRVSCPRARLLLWLAGLHGGQPAARAPRGLAVQQSRRPSSKSSSARTAPAPELGSPCSSFPGAPVTGRARAPRSFGSSPCRRRGEEGVLHGPTGRSANRPRPAPRCAGRPHAPSCRRAASQRPRRASDRGLAPRVARREVKPASSNRGRHRPDAVPGPRGARRPREALVMEYLVTMTTNVPDGTSDEEIMDIRAREAARSRRARRAGLPAPPLAPTAAAGRMAFARPLRR